MLVSTGAFERCRNKEEASILKKAISKAKGAAALRAALDQALRSYAMAAGGDGPGGTAEERPLPCDLHRPGTSCYHTKSVDWRSGLAAHLRLVRSARSIPPGRFLAPERSPGVLLWAGRV